MSGNYLLDEHLPRWWPNAIFRRQPGLKVWFVGAPGAPTLSSPDPQILEWCETHRFMLITNNRKSMPVHFADHLAHGRHVPGILTIDLRIDIALLADQLALIAGAALPGDFDDQIKHLPL